MQNIIVIIGIWGVALSFLVPFLTLILATEGGRNAATNAANADSSTVAITEFVKEILSKSFRMKRHQFFFSLPFSILFFFIFLGLSKDAFMPSVDGASPERFISFFIAFVVCNVLGDWLSVLQSTYLIKRKLEVNQSEFSFRLALFDFAISLVIFFLMISVSLWLTLMLSNLGVGLPASNEVFLRQLLDNLVDPITGSQNDPVRNSFFWISLLSTLTSTYLHLGIWGWVLCLRTVRNWHDPSTAIRAEEHSAPEELISNSLFLLLCLIFGLLIIGTIAWPGIQLLTALAFWVLQG